MPRAGSNTLAAFFIAAILFPFASFAADGALVRVVQPPAWVERAGIVVALRPGDALLVDDVIRTGPGGRVQVDLPEGSRVKLGEEVAFGAQRLRESTDDRGDFFDAAFDVLKGAFRFTTGLAGRERRRDVTFRVGTVSAGIRGTDIWGKSTGNDGHTVLLLEGQVVLGVPGQDVVLIEQPLHGVTMTPDGEMRAVKGISQEALEQYAAETEMNPARGAMTIDGKWQVIVMSLRHRELAERMQAALVAEGFPAEIDDMTVNGNLWHRVVLTRLASAKDAQLQGEMLVGRFGIYSFWLRRE